VPAAQPQIYAPYNTPALIEGMSIYGETALDPWYVTGLVEGEGCFCISFALRSKLKTGLEVRPSFSLSLNERDRELLRDLQTYFGCGQIRVSRGDRSFKYEARALRDHVERIVPHFGRYPLRGSKANSFRAFADVCRMVEQGDHLQRDGLREIVRMACRSSLGKRRYSESELLRTLGEVKG
jgi:LAGLIDADG endonuclease